MTALREAPADPASRPQGTRRWVVAGLGLLIVAALLSLCLGASQVSPLALVDSTREGAATMDARLVRTALGILIGAAFGLAGACMQGLTRNPLADPGILGINAGAAFAIILSIVLFGAGGLTSYIWFGLIGAALAAVVVHGIAGMARGGATPVTLSIAGAALTAAVTSWGLGLQLIDRNALETLRRWQVGTIGGRSWDILLDVLPFLAVGALLALVSARILDALALGDDVARSLGRNATRDRLVVGLAIVLLAGGATSVAGPVGFVGLIVPHVVRRFTGPTYQRILPASAVGGAILVLIADTLGRVVLPPSEVQVGVMVALIGVPFFIFLIRRGRLGAL